MPTHSATATVSSTAPPASAKFREESRLATINVALVGCGAFARFSVQQYRTLPGVRIAAVADVNPEAALRTATALGAAFASPLVAFWLGQGRVVSAARSVRPTITMHETGGEPPIAAGDGAVEEQVSCTCRYARDTFEAPPPGPGLEGFRPDPHAGVLFHFEHGFHQPARLDRQELRLVFERGELRLFDWVPTHGFVRGLVNDASREVLASILPSSACHVVRRYDADEGRFRPFEAAALVEVTFTTGMDKQELYGRVVRDLAADQIARIRNPVHLRRLTEADSVAAVAMACEADRMALDAG